MPASRGHRAMIMSGEYDKVFPFDIYPEYLLKAIMAKDIEKMGAAWHIRSGSGRLRPSRICRHIQDRAAEGGTRRIGLSMKGNAVTQNNTTT